MTEIYIIRHAQAEGNIYKMMQGHWDGGVTALGRQQIAALAERFKDTKVDAVYSSDLFRARLTAGAILKHHDIPLILDERFREINVGPWEGKYFGNVMHEQPHEMDLFTNDPAKWQIDGAETYSDVQKRAMEALTKLAEANDGKAIAVTSHGVTICCMLAAITGRPYTGENKVPICGNTAIAKVIYDDGKFSLEYANDCEHLSTVKATKWSWSGVVRSESVNPADEQAYYKACYKDAWLAAHGSSALYNPAPYYQSALQHYSANKEAIIKIYIDENEAGLIDLDPQRGAEDGIGWISLVYLKPEYRYQGYGIQLLGRAFFFFEKLGRKRVRLHVSEDNSSALAFYKHWGFETIAIDAGAKAPLYLMEKTLGTERK